MDVGVQDVLDRGFYPELPWSLRGNGSLHPDSDHQVHILTRTVFEHVPFIQLSAVLPASLERGLELLNEMTADSILAEGEKSGR